MSFDKEPPIRVRWITKVLIPFVQGNVFRPSPDTNSLKRDSLNPFRTGQCLSTQDINHIEQSGHGLNPFRTGQCLSTVTSIEKETRQPVLIPFVQGNVFRHL